MLRTSRRFAIANVLRPPHDTMRSPARPPGHRLAIVLAIHTQVEKPEQEPKLPSAAPLSAVGCIAAIAQPARTAPDDMLVELKTRGEKILYVWDYFYISCVAAAGDEAPWRAIERATCRIRMSEIDVSDSTPVDIRFRAARRMRDAARLALRQIERLVNKPEQWVIDALVDIEAFAAELVVTLSEPSRQVIVH